MLIICEGKPYLSAILVLNPEEWRQPANRQDLDPGAEESLASDKRQ